MPTRIFNNAAIILYLLDLTSGTDEFLKLEAVNSLSFLLGSTHRKYEILSTLLY